VKSPAKLKRFSGENREKWAQTPNFGTLAGKKGKEDAAPLGCVGWASHKF
jgi:hypothetical protein